MEPTFWIFAAVMSGIQLYAALEIKHMPIDEISIVLGAGCFAATTYLLASAYHKYQEAMRPKILHVRDELIGQKGRTQADPISEASAGFESLHLAVFYGNALYGFLTLVFAWFVLKDVNTYINYAIASVVPAFIVLLLASMDASKKKSKL